ncbi:MAG: hypothetical protein GTO03_01185 [Planctomycetales bacterium]|nr:hypothetical protein [Planctomycetales bacterium]
MNQPQPPRNDPDNLQEAVTAYLDGELDVDGARLIEDRLAHDAPFRSQVQSLQQTWELLDRLPQVAADPNFAATTVEMVAVTVRDESPHAAQRFWRRWGRPAGLLVGAALAACLAGFLLTSGIAALFTTGGLLADADDRLLQDLPVVEHLDKYLVAEDVQFLRALRAHPSAARIATTDLAPGQQTVLSDEPVERRRARVAQMSPQEKHQLAVNHQRFAAFPPARQETLRAFHRQLIEDQQREELAGILDAFYQWYQHLAPEQRGELRGRPQAQRLASLDHLLAQQEKQRRADVVWQDAQATIRWFQDLALRHRDQLIQGTPEATSPPPGDVDHPAHRYRLLRLLWQRWDQGRDPQNPPLTDHDLARLKPALSPAGQQVLAAAPDPKTALARLLDYLPPQFWRPWVGGRRRGYPGPPFPHPDPAGSPGAVSRDELMRFFHQRLTPEQQERLKRLPPDQFLGALRQEYLQAAFGGPRPPAGDQRPPHPPPPRWSPGPAF